MVAATIRLTSKRQATFPKELCEALELKPGDALELSPRIEGGERVWILRRKDRPDRPWLGRLKHYAESVDDHSMSAIRESIEKGRSPRTTQ